MKRNYVAKALAVFAATVYGVCVIYIETQKQFEAIYYLFIPYYTALAVTYVSVIVLLNIKMSKLIGDFDMEVGSINKQFIVFLIAYITKLAFYFAQVSTDNMFSNFYGCIFISSIQLVWNILPVFYSLY